MRRNPVQDTWCSGTKNEIGWWASRRKEWEPRLRMMRRMMMMREMVRGRVYDSSPSFRDKT